MVGICQREFVICQPKARSEKRAIAGLTIKLTRHDAVNIPVDMAGCGHASA